MADDENQIKIQDSTGEEELNLKSLIQTGELSLNKAQDGEATTTTDDRTARLMQPKQSTRDSNKVSDRIGSGIGE